MSHQPEPCQTPQFNTSLEHNHQAEHAGARKSIKLNTLRRSKERKGKLKMSRHQWEDMKPLIQRIYIDDNKPFPYLAHILRTEHGFAPT
jgi:hypothetical protein